MELTLDLGATRVPQQALLGSHTTRMVAGDLRDLEHEAAVATTEIFSSTGVSYPREDLETSMFNDMFSTAAVPPRMELEPNIGRWFPDQTMKVDRLMHERVGLLRKLMQKSSSWEHALADLAGDVSYIIQIDPDFLHSPEGRAAFVNGDVFEAAQAAGVCTESQIGQQGDPRAWLDEDPFAFPNPMFFDAMFSKDVKPGDVLTTREYRHLKPWFLDDVDEELVAQWVFDHTGRTPWSGSSTAYMLASRLAAGLVTEEEWPAYHRVISGANRMQEHRQQHFKVGLDTDPKQRLLIRPDGDRS